MTDKQRSYAILNFKTDYTDLFEVRAGFKGGQTGQLPRASTTRRGPPQKHTHTRARV